MPNENGIRASIKNTVDLKKIQALMNEAHVDILVGFAGGQHHRPTLHRKSKKDELKDLEGNTSDNVKPIDVDKLARMLHFGTADIPARPFLTDGIRQNLDKIKKDLREQSQKLAEGKKANWDKVGADAAAWIKEFISSDYYKTRVPNSKRTIEYKGSDMPLIDGADMKNSITFLVRRAK